jgi:hypothetical protein
MTKTEVKLLAFDLSFSTGITIDDFYRWMVASEEASITANGYTNHILVDIHQNYIVGVALCFKGDRKILATSEEGDLLSVEKIELKDNQNSTQAAIFCIDPNSLCGMFYSYHGGVSKSNFGNLLSKIHEKSLNEKIKGKATELSDFGKKSGSFFQKAQTYFPGQFTINFKFKSHDIDTLLSSFSQFNSLEMTISPALEQTSAFQPIINMSKSVRTAISFDGKISNEHKRSAILNWWHAQKNKELISKLKVVGKAVFGTALEEQLGDNLEHFDKLFLDDYIDALPNKDWRDYLNSEILKRLMKNVSSNSLIMPIAKPASTWQTSLTKKDISSITK